MTGSEAIESQLGLKRGALEGPAAGWLDVLHPLDRDRYTLALDGLLHQRSGRINHDLRLRGVGRPLFLVRAEGAAGRRTRRRGRARHRLAGGRHRDQVRRGAHAPRRHPRQSDRPAQSRVVLSTGWTAALHLAQRPGATAPTVLVVDIDHFKTVNDSFGLSIGDSALLAVARRLSRDLKPGDTLARLAGDQFGAIVLADDARAPI